jgi:tetratricopeptide (TPR) repeat protein
VSTGRVLVVALALAARAMAGPSPQGDVRGALAEGKRLEAAGDARGALESYLWAVEASRQGSADRAHALLSLANVEAGLGKYAESSRHAAEATTIFEAVGDPAGASLALNRQGVTAIFAGDYADADRLLRLALARSTTDSDREARAEQLTNLANVQFYFGRYADASRLYQEALAVTEAAAGQPWAARRRRLTLANEATLQLRIGRYQQALATFDELDAASAELRPRERAEVLVNRGVLYRRLGDPIKALAAYEEARTLFAGDRAADGELNALKNEGIVLALDLGRLDEARRNFTTALDRARASGNKHEMLHARLYRGETNLRDGQRDTAREDYAAALAIAREVHTPEEEWKALYGLGRVADSPAQAVEHLEAAVRTIEAVREGIRVQSLRTDFLSDKREVYDALIKAKMPVAATEAIFQLLERSHSRVWRERLGLAGAIDLASIQRALPPGALLLDYWQSALGSAVIAVSRARAAVIPLDVDDRRLVALIDLMSAGPSSAWRPIARDLGSRLLPPGEWFEGVDRVLIVPDGPLALVPFDVLPLGESLLIERAAVSYAPTAATLLRAVPRRRGFMAPWELEVRVFADPLVSSSELDDPSMVRGRLGASAEEARGIAGELAGRAALHLGADNRKHLLFSGAERAPILHLATHAVADDSALEQSRIMFSPAGGSSTRADYLFLKEAYGLPLDGVELAVLSACDTERGRVVRGEGVESFSRAFLAAGARSTVTTMWRVADRPTADFMEVFYHHLQRGVARDEALRLAKLKFAHSGSELADPHFWAAFVLTGEALRPLPRAISWASVGLGVAVPTTLAALLARVLSTRRRRRAGAAIALR